MLDANENRRQRCLIFLSLFQRSEAEVKISVYFEVSWIIFGDREKTRITHICVCYHVTVRGIALDPDSPFRK